MMAATPSGRMASASFLLLGLVCLATAALNLQDCKNQETAVGNLLTPCLAGPGPKCCDVVRVWYACVCSLLHSVL